MSSTNKTSLGLNMWEASDKPVRQDFVNDNLIIDKEVTNLRQDVVNGNADIDEKINKLNSNLTNLAQKTLVNGYRGAPSTENYTLEAFATYLIVCGTVGSGNTNNIAVYIVVSGASAINNGVINTLVANSSINLTLTGLTLAITSSAYHTTAIKKL
jgi:hypothetical protein